MSGSPGALIKRAPVIPRFLRFGCCHKGHSAAINRPFWYSEHTAVIIGGTSATSLTGGGERDAWVAHSAVILSRTFLIQKTLYVVVCPAGGGCGVEKRLSGTLNVRRSYFRSLTHCFSHHIDTQPCYMYEYIYI